MVIKKNVKNEVTCNSLLIRADIVAEISPAQPTAIHIIYWNYVTITRIQVSKVVQAIFTYADAYHKQLSMQVCVYRRINLGVSTVKNLIPKHKPSPFES